ncbi:MAG: dihydropteroate synthase [Actinomycetota bacterium]|jgi:dihydropteroate synthase|nr:dihydropteroate synthase [Actinomycetota bacterium]
MIGPSGERPERVERPERPKVMGILNVTPDSFFDGGRFVRTDAAIEHGHQLFDQGADVVDVGGESTRPGAEPVPEDEELRRVVPVVEALAARGPVSIDTTKPAVARAAAGAGATLINDVSGTLWPVAAELGTGWVAMHMRGTPRDMQHDPRYDDVAAEVQRHVMELAAAASAAGVSEVWVDPGIGFGKTPDHNLTLLRRLGDLVATAAEAGYGVLVGTSRKSFLGRYGAASGAPLPVEDRLEASLATAAWAMCSGAKMVRVHDVAPTCATAALVAGSVTP